MAEARAADRAHGPCQDLPPLLSTVSGEVQGGSGGKARAARRLTGTERGKDHGGHAPHVEDQSGGGYAVLPSARREDAVWGTRPASLAEPQGPQERVQRHTVEQLAEVASIVQILDDPVPQTVVQLDVLKIIDTPVPEQVIEVPKIFSQDRVPQRVVLPGAATGRTVGGSASPVFPASASLRRRCGRSCWHRSGTLPAAFGASALGRVGSTGGCRVHDTPSGPARRDSLPAQSGIQILGRAEAGALLWDVPVLVQRRGVRT